jgi:hypothetical protein
MQRMLKIGSPPHQQQFTPATAAQTRPLMGTSPPRTGTWRQNELQNRAEALARGDATHAFATSAGLENALILDMALVGVGTAWVTVGRADIGNYHVDRVNTISRDVQAIFAPVFGPGGDRVTVSLLGFDFQRLTNPGGGFWLTPVRDNVSGKAVKRNVGTYPLLSPQKAAGLLDQFENRAHATERDLESLMAMIVSLVAEPRRWPGQNVFTALTLSDLIIVPEGRALTGDIGVLPLSAGSTWDETAQAPQPLARTRIIEGLSSWFGDRTALNTFFGGLAADFDAAASLNAFHIAATTRFEARL